MAAYPQNIFQWVPRVDEQDIVYAHDPNTLASEIQAVEQAVGLNPQIESSPPAGGSPVTFASESARLTAANNNAMLPYVTLTNTTGFYCGEGDRRWHSYTSLNDPYSLWNGQAITIPVNGWWVVQMSHRCDQDEDRFYGRCIMWLWHDDDWLDWDHWEWTDRWEDDEYYYPDDLLGEEGRTKVMWQGPLTAGSHLQGLTHNASYCPRLRIYNMALSAICIRTF